MSKPRWPTPDEQTPESADDASKEPLVEDRPVRIDVERTAMALASESILIPAYLGREELRAFLLAAAHAR